MADADFKVFIVFNPTFGTNDFSSLGSNACYV